MCRDLIANTLTFMHGRISQSLPIRQFLLTNLQRQASDTEFDFRIPLDILGNAISDIGDFPYDETDRITFDKPTLFIKGGDSKYINRKNIPVANALFPQNRLVTVDGVGHWGECPKHAAKDQILTPARSLVHSEKPKEFVDIVADFCKSR